MPLTYRPRHVASAAALLLTALMTTTPPAAAALEWADAPATVVLDDLNGPIDFAIARDGTIWWNEYYTGDVLRSAPPYTEREVMFHADPIENGVERGMVGLALDPERDDVFYVYYTTADPQDPDGGTNRLSRIDGDHETVLLTLSAAPRHNGGRIVAAPDGTLYVATGENNRPEAAQDPASLLGKILHLHRDGTAAAGNVDGYVYSLGHRNVYGLAYDPATDRLFATENGNAERDEVNLIRAGHNYGWPHCEGFAAFDPLRYVLLDETCADERFTRPIGEFYADRTSAPTGATIFRGDLHWASWNEGSIHRMREDAVGGGWTDQVLYRPGGRINDLEAGPDGRAIYFSTWTRIVRLDPPEPPTIPLSDASILTFPAPPTADAGNSTTGTQDGTPSTRAQAEASTLAAVAAAVGLAAAAWLSRRRRG